MHFDMTPKPALREIKRLFCEEFHTDAVQKTDERGRARFKGFYGCYDVEISVGGNSYKKELHLEKGPDTNPEFKFVI